MEVIVMDGMTHGAVKVRMSLIPRIVRQAAAEVTWAPTWSPDVAAWSVENCPVLGLAMAVKALGDHKVAGWIKVAQVLEFGAAKYSVDGWKSVAAELYTNAAYRHLAWHPDAVDEESGFPHLWHVGANMVILTWFRLRGC